MLTYVRGAFAHAEFYARYSKKIDQIVSELDARRPSHEPRMFHAESSRKVAAEIDAFLSGDEEHIIGVCGIIGNHRQMASLVRGDSCVSLFLFDPLWNDPQRAHFLDGAAAGFAEAWSRLLAGYPNVFALLHFVGTQHGGFECADHAIDFSRSASRYAHAMRRVQLRHLDGTLLPEIESVNLRLNARLTDSLPGRAFFFGAVSESVPNVLMTNNLHGAKAVGPGFLAALLKRRRPPSALHEAAGRYDVQDIDIGGGRALTASSTSDTESRSGTIFDERLRLLRMSSNCTARNEEMPTWTDPPRVGRALLPCALARPGTRDCGILAVESLLFGRATLSLDRARRLLAPEARAGLTAADLAGFYTRRFAMLGASERAGIHALDQPNARPVRFRNRDACLEPSALAPRLPEADFALADGRAAPRFAILLAFFAAGAPREPHDPHWVAVGRAEGVWHLCDSGEGKRIMLRAAEEDHPRDAVKTVLAVVQRRVLSSHVASSFGSNAEVRIDYVVPRGKVGAAPDDLIIRRD